MLSGTLQEAGDIEANVATGYHAIEFLLWGQDLNGTRAGAGERPYTDFDTANCTGGNCDRRAAYLAAATDLLVADLEEMVANWKADGAARKGADSTAMPNAGISTILTGMGSLSYGELAGERMKLGLLLHDPEEEHDCFSDNTHISHLYDAIGIRNVYHGSYKRVDGTKVEGPSVSDLVKEADAGARRRAAGKLDATVAKMEAIRSAPRAARPTTSRSARAMPKATPPCRRRSTRWSTRPSRSSAPLPRSSSTRSPSRGPTASMLPTRSSSKSLAATLDHSQAARISRAAQPAPRRRC